MEIIIEIINRHRDLSPNTLKGYYKSLDRLKNKLNIDLVPDFLKSPEIILNYIKTEFKKPYQLNLLNAYIVAVDSWLKDGTTHNPMDDSYILENGLALFKKYQMEIKYELDKTKYDEAKTPKEEENWINWETVEKTVGENFKGLKDILKLTKSEISKKDIQQVQLWVISGLYGSGEQNPPLRLDYNRMVIISKEKYEQEKEAGLTEGQNFLIIESSKIKYFLLAEYKTVSKFGKKSLKVGSKLNTILNKWIKIREKYGIDNPYLLFNNQEKAVGESAMSMYIKDAFKLTGKSIKANLLRHIFISDVVIDMSLKKRKKMADFMCHSLEQQLIYNKLPSGDSSGDESN